VTDRPAPKCGARCLLNLPGYPERGSTVLRCWHSKGHTRAPGNVERVHRCGPWVWDDDDPNVLPPVDDN